MNSNKKVIFIVIAITLVILYYNSNNIMNYLNTISEFKYENLDKDLPEDLVLFRDVTDEDYYFSSPSSTNSSIDSTETVVPIKK